MGGEMSLAPAWPGPKAIFTYLCVSKIKLKMSCETLARARREPDTQRGERSSAKTSHYRRRTIGVDVSV
jgi:hypothetical protein